MTQSQSAVPAQSLPLKAKDISLDWLNEVLSGLVGNARISSFDYEIIGVGQGLMGQLARLRLEYDSTNSVEQLPNSIIAKFASTNSSTREMARLQKCYEREVGFYRDIADEVGVATAKCYYAEHLPISNHFVILLADLSPAATSNQIEGTSKADGQWVIEAIAKVHAKWWNSEKLEDLDWAQPLTNSMSPEEGLLMIKASIKKAEAEGTFKPYPEIERLMKLLPPLFLMKPPQPFPFTLCHGDLRSDNLFCPDETGGSYALIDWQLTGIGQPAGDLARWFSQSITIEQRRETETDLLKLYHQRLVEYGVTGYSYKRLIRDYQLNLVIILLMFTNSMDEIDQSPLRVKQLLHKMYARLDAALVDWKIINLLRVLPYLVPFLKLSSWLGSMFNRQVQGKAK